MPAQAFFLPASSGQRLCIAHRPAAAVRGAVLYLHPWAEEMNKSRRMAALAAAQMAAEGWLVLQIDLKGCGDSSHTWAEASWQDWVDDALLGAAWLQQQAGGVPLWLWGLRSGALLASAAAQRLAQPCHQLYWQAVPAGRALLQQFLRLKGAASLDGDAKAAIESVRRGLAAGLVQHIAGYPLSPALAQGLEAASLQPPPALPAGAAPRRLVWLEVSSRPEPALLPASGPVLLAWRAAGHAVQAEVLAGPAFWQTQEIEDAPQLLQATRQALAAPAAARAAETAA